MNVIGRHEAKKLFEKIDGLRHECDNGEDRTIVSYSVSLLECATRNDKERRRDKVLQVARELIHFVEQCKAEESEAVELEKAYAEREARKLLAS